MCSSVIITWIFHELPKRSSSVYIVNLIIALTVLTCIDFKRDFHGYEVLPLNSQLQKGSNPRLLFLEVSILTMCSHLYAPISMLQSLCCNLYAPISVLHLYAPISMFQSLSSYLYAPISMHQSLCTNLYAQISMFKSLSSYLYAQISMHQSKFIS